MNIGTRYSCNCPRTVDPYNVGFTDMVVTEHDEDCEHFEWGEAIPCPNLMAMLKAKTYEGSLLDDCASIVELGEQLKAKMAEPVPAGLFERARRLNEAAADHEAMLVTAFNKLDATHLSRADQSWINRAINNQQEDTL